MITDVWMQHPTLRFLGHGMFESLRRWTSQQVPEDQPPIDATVAAMDHASVDFGLLSAWSAPHQPPLISNDGVAEWVSAHPTRFAGLAAVDLNRPMEGVRIALDFPELVIIGGHIGYPWTEEMIAVARKHENVYIDTSGYTAKRYPPELVAYMKSRSGRPKVMFGTNYPMVLHQQALEHLDGLELDREGRDLFLAGNAQRVLALAPG